MSKIAVEYRTLCSSEGYGSVLLTQYKRGTCARSKKVSKIRPLWVGDLDAMEDVYHEGVYLIDMISVANLDILQQNLPEDIVQPNRPDISCS